jgi:autotransporter family porin
MRRLLSALLLGALISGASVSNADPLDPNNYASLGTLNVSSGTLTFDTDALTVSGAFSGSGVLQSQGVGLPDIAVFTFSNINVPIGVTLNLNGSRPIAILSQGDVTILPALTANAFGFAGRLGGASGGAPGSNGQGPGGGVAGTSTVFTGATIGGGGGGFGSLGGAAGGAPSFVGGSSYGNLATALQGGSGGAGSAVAGAGGTAGGGAIEIGANGVVNVPSVIASGIGSAGLVLPGVGGGSGGAILLHGTSVTGTLNAAGGVGGSGFQTTTTPGGGGAGGRVLVITGAYTLGSTLSANVQGGFAGQPGANPGGPGVAQIVADRTILPSGFVRQLDTNGTFTVPVNGFSSYQSGNLQVNSGALVFSTSAITSSHDLALQGGQASVAAGWTAAGSAQISGLGQLNAPFAGGAGNSIAASGGVLTIGDANSSGAFQFGGAISVSSNATLQVQAADQAQLGRATTLAANSRLASLNGVLISGGTTLGATGDATVEGAVTNQGMVNGPTGAGQALTFADAANGAGGYSGNIRFSGGFAPGNSPAAVTFAGNATFDATSLLEMELGGLTPGGGYDKVIVAGLLTLGNGTLDVTDFDGFTPTAGNMFDLLDWGSLSGTFSQIMLPTLSDGLAWDVSRLYLDGTISVAAVPEPQTYAMLLAGLALLTFAMRRRSF